MSKTAFDLSKIKGIAFDVDGVLSPSAVPLGDDGVPRRLANTKDGFALREGTRKGLKIAIISGAVAPGLRERFAMLGIDDVYRGMQPVSRVICSRRGYASNPHGGSVCSTR